MALKSIEEIISQLPEKLNKELLDNSSDLKDSILGGILRDEFKLYCNFHEIIVHHLEDLQKNLMGKNMTLHKNNCNYIFMTI